MYPQPVVQPTQYVITGPSGAGPTAAVIAAPVQNLPVQTATGTTVIQGYPNATQFIIPSVASAPGGQQQQLIAANASVPSATSAPIPSNLNQLVQVVLGNGQVLTTTYANLQSMGITAGPVNLPPAGTAMYTTANQTTTTVQQTQFIANAAGQIFAVTPQLISPQQVPQQTAVIATNQSPTQYIQVATPHGIQLIAAQMQPQTIQINQNQTPIVQQPHQSVTSTVQNSSSSQAEAARLHVQQIIQQQQQQILQQQQAQQQQKLQQQALLLQQQQLQSAQVQVHSNTDSQKHEMTTLIDYGDDKDEVRLEIDCSQESSPTPAESAASQQTVSSTTPSKPKINYATTNANESSLKSRVTVSQTENTSNLFSKTDNRYVSVQSQTLSTPTSSPVGSAIEPESTTQNIITLAHTISNTDASIVDGVNLEEIKEFARQFKLRRLSLGLTQTQVGQALSATEGPSYSQSAICRFEKLDITPKSAQKIKPVLEKWMREAEERYKNGHHTLTDFIGSDNNKKRKRRTSFTPAALETLNAYFEKHTHPSGSEMTELAEQLNYDREVVRVWFCNKRQALRNTVKKIEPSQITTM